MIREVLRFVVRIDTDAWAQTTLKSDAPGTQNCISAEGYSEIPANSEGLSANCQKSLLIQHGDLSSSLSLAFYFSSSSLLFFFYLLLLQSFLTSVHLPHLRPTSPPPARSYADDALLSIPIPPKINSKIAFLINHFFLFITSSTVVHLYSKDLPSDLHTSHNPKLKAFIPPFSNLQQVIPPSAVQLLHAGTSPRPSSSLFLPPSTAPSFPLSQEPKTLLSFAQPTSTASRPPIRCTSSSAIISLHRPPPDPRCQRRPPLPPAESTILQRQLRSPRFSAAATSSSASPSNPVGPPHASPPQQCPPPTADRHRPRHQMQRRRLLTSSPSTRRLFSTAGHCYSLTGISAPL